MCTVLSIEHFLKITATIAVIIFNSLTISVPLYFVSLEIIIHLKSQIDHLEKLMKYLISKI